MAVTIVEQWNEQLSIGATLRFPVNCVATYSLLVSSSNESNTSEFAEEMDVIREASEVAFKSNPDYSTQDLNMDRGSWALTSFENGVGSIQVTFNVIDAEVTLTQYYGFPASMSPQDMQISLEDQAQQYGVNYKIGNNLVNL